MDYPITEGDPQGQAQRAQVERERAVTEGVNVPASYDPADMAPSPATPAGVSAAKQAAAKPVAAAELDHQLAGADSPLAGWVQAIGDMADSVMTQPETPGDGRASAQ